MNHEIAEFVIGTCKSPAEIAEHFDIPIDDIEEILLDNNIEMCPECSWWVDSFELVDEEGESISCLNCRS